jgi:protein-S-isoprenylcysteine O-methyltransferase Ste14
MKKLNTFGIGPKIAVVALPWLAASIIITIYYKDIFKTPESLDRILTVAGIILLVIGLIFYVATGRLLMQGLKGSKMITTGSYYLCQNPLYTSILLMVIPGVAFLLHSWLILTTSLVAYIMFKINIKSEYKEMEEFFGEAYLTYKKNTPEFFPFPFKKWFGK